MRSSVIVAQALAAVRSILENRRSASIVATGSVARVRNIVFRFTKGSFLNSYVFAAVLTSFAAFNAHSSKNKTRRL